MTTTTPISHPAHALAVEIILGLSNQVAELRVELDREQGLRDEQVRALTVQVEDADAETRNAIATMQDVKGDLDYLRQENNRLNRRLIEKDSERRADADRMMEAFGHLKAGRKINAIKDFRAATGLSLQVCKDFVEALTAMKRMAYDDGYAQGRAHAIAENDR